MTKEQVGELKLQRDQPAGIWMERCLPQLLKHSGTGLSGSRTSSAGEQPGDCGSW